MEYDEILNILAPCGLNRRWIEMNSRMKEIGVRAYYAETKDLCRYR